MKRREVQRKIDRQIEGRVALFTINIMYFLQDDVNVKFTYTGIPLPKWARYLAETTQADEDDIKTAPDVKNFLQTAILSFGKFFYLILIFYPNVHNCIVLSISLLKLCILCVNVCITVGRRGTGVSLI